ncbi:hypothetical protein HYW76_01970 [Candidatus Pacearchaeota archaeon]|nr:hypothetical protein [Candidatus Pacearchaeota archaeon]
MTELDKIFTGKVKDKAIFDFSELYTFCYTWLVDQGYWVVEKSYSEKIQANGKDVEIEWNASKRISDYFRFAMKVRWRILGMKDAEVEKDGAKVTMNKGAFEISLSATLEKDYESRWENNSFNKFLRGLYDRYIIRSRIEDYETKLYIEGDEFLAQVKAFLALEGKH